MIQKQNIADRTKINYGYIEYLRKAMEKNSCPLEKERKLIGIKFHEARRNYYSQSLKPINHLIQIDERPNLGLMEPKWELYKISISFEAISTSYNFNSSLEFKLSY